MLVATGESFEGDWYFDPYRGNLAHYRDNGQFLTRAQVIRGRFATGKVLVAGCGLGSEVLLQ